MKTFELKNIGDIKKTESRTVIILKEEFKTALLNLNGYSHIHVLWWAHLTDSKERRNRTLLGKIFKNGPDILGVFATRSPFRPNPVMVSIVEIKNIDYENGFVYTSFIDAGSGSPVLDIKPYQLMERVKNCQVPDWCSHWPKWHEDTVNFDWSKEIN
jgi:tRNA (adenine37-N6)-methyltransferase